MWEGKLHETLSPLTSQASAEGNPGATQLLGLPVSRVLTRAFSCPPGHTEEGVPEAVERMH